MRAHIPSLCFLIFLAAPAKAQVNFGPEGQPPTRLLLDAEIGAQGGLGCKLISTRYGATMERLVGSLFEMQATLAYSPDRKLVTNNGNSLLASGAAIAWATPRVGLTGGYERAWLWTSQFEKKAGYPTAGFVLRNDLFGPGRLYVAYLFPTGCVWATSHNPCTIQSNRTQGVQVKQEFRVWSHLRVGWQGEVLHFCDQANPNAPQISRTCHWAATSLFLPRFEFPRVRADESY
jgi:hypothetical protein